MSDRLIEEREKNEARLLFECLTNRIYDITSCVDTRWCDGNFILTEHYPVIQIENITVCKTEKVLNEDDYWLADAAIGRIELRGDFGKVKVGYVFGFEELPDDIKYAIEGLQGMIDKYYIDNPKIKSVVRRYKRR